MSYSMQTKGQIIISYTYLIQHVRYVLNDYYFIRSTQFRSSVNLSKSCLVLNNLTQCGQPFMCIQNIFQRYVSSFYSFDVHMNTRLWRLSALPTKYPSDIRYTSHFCFAIKNIFSLEKFHILLAFKFEYFTIFLQSSSLKESHIVLLKYKKKKQQAV